MALKLKVKGGGFYKDQTTEEVLGFVVELRKIVEDWVGGEVLIDCEADEYESLEAHFLLRDATSTSITTSNRQFQVEDESGFPYFLILKGGTFQFVTDSDSIHTFGNSGYLDVTLYYQSAKEFEKTYDLSEFTNDHYILLVVGNAHIPGYKDDEFPPYDLDLDG